MTERALEYWGRKVARLPGAGSLLVSTDLQGNWGDYQALKAHRQPDELLLLVGDLVHGPGGWALERWPEYLGSPYVDRSRELILDFEQLSLSEPVFALLGNHEHAHIGGPRVAKFHEDEAAVLDAALGDDAARVHDFMRSFPLLAVGDGVVFVHGAPGATEASLEDFERLRYDGYDSVRIREMYGRDTLADLLWSRCASTDQALDLLEACTGRREGVVVYGHDVVRSGFEAEDAHQLCLSTSFGLFDPHKTMLRLDLGRPIRSVQDLEEGLLPLYPELKDAR